MKRAKANDKKAHNHACYPEKELALEAKMGCHPEPTPEPCFMDHEAVLTNNDRDFLLSLLQIVENNCEDVRKALLTANSKEVIRAASEIHRASKSLKYGSSQLLCRETPAAGPPTPSISLYCNRLGVEDMHTDMVAEAQKSAKASLAVKKKPTHKEVHGIPLIFSIDDDEINQRLIQQLLKPTGFKVCRAMDGPNAIRSLEESECLPDLILLDVVMPRMSGYAVCARIRELYPDCNIPIIMMSARSSQENIIEGLQAGSNDYVVKPFHRAEMLARIETQLKLKDAWRVEVEATRNLQLLQKMLPDRIIRRLQAGQTMISDSHEDVTILFTDIVGFTRLASTISTMELVVMLNELFTGFDNLVDKYNVYKVETIGDAYMAVAGHDGSANHAERMLQLAMEIITFVKEVSIANITVQIRVGIHTGPAHAGVIGMKCPRYCFFGDTVNTASRMESNGFPMAVHVSESTYSRLKDKYEFVPFGQRQIKGKGLMATYLLKYGRYREALEMKQNLCGLQTPYVIDSFGSNSPTSESGHSGLSSPVSPDMCAGSSGSSAALTSSVVNVATPTGADAMTTMADRFQRARPPPIQVIGAEHHPDAVRVSRPWTEPHR
eukprot:jgi/Chlat1/8030/Chrsp71S07504